jgi:TolA-binding protein
MGVPDPDSVTATVQERDVLLCLHTLLGVLASRAQTIHDLSMAPPRASVGSMEASVAASAAFEGASEEIGRLRRALALEQRGRQLDAEARTKAVRELEERLRGLSTQSTDLRQKLSHSEHRVRQREAELDEVKARLRKRGPRQADGTRLTVLVTVLFATCSPHSLGFKRRLCWCT